ncbi:Predicted signal transduction protein containing sensor and EAL domains [Xanthomonas oryzae pv. oryzae KACC 10331]|uniref:Predicted signal transduction protein containing sensor and EAL domains n=1 Tax=Xanthomonas oryzae pv. oryzae (strain KACC10331 / KXO85) TaxID=291331 RepID=Q5GUC7_XANOR|nr:Predicted signal transduction protein containing sensor and EAL domains [Xanthomonas oryzae pv. oryzae KACC 10331]
MKRQRIISATVLLVLLCATLPVGLFYYLAWRLALAREEGRLSQLAALSIRRTETAFDEAHGALLNMAASRLPLWSPAHLAQMRALVLTSHYIVELGRFRKVVFAVPHGGNCPTAFRSPPPISWSSAASR